LVAPSRRAYDRVPVVGAARDVSGGSRHHRHDPRPGPRPGWTFDHVHGDPDLHAEGEHLSTVGHRCVIHVGWQRPRIERHEGQRLALPGLFCDQTSRSLHVDRRSQDMRELRIERTAQGMRFIRGDLFEFLARSSARGNRRREPRGHEDPTRLFSHRAVKHNEDHDRACRHVHREINAPWAGRTGRGRHRNGKRPDRRESDRRGRAHRCAVLAAFRDSPSPAAAQTRLMGPEALVAEIA
jgi:hypothetical protein